MNRPPGRGSTPGALIKVPIKKSNGRGNGKLAPPASQRLQPRQLAQAKGNISVLNRSQASRNAPCSSWSSEAPRWWKAVPRAGCEHGEGAWAGPGCGSCGCTGPGLCPWALRDGFSVRSGAQLRVSVGKLPWKLGPRSLGGFSCPGCRCAVLCSVGLFPLEPSANGHWIILE